MTKCKGIKIPTEHDLIFLTCFDDFGAILMYMDIKRTMTQSSPLSEGHKMS